MTSNASKSSAQRQPLRARTSSDGVIVGRFAEAPVAVHSSYGEMTKDVE